jgi:hypothetical protein
MPIKTIRLADSHVAKLKEAERMLSREYSRFMRHWSRNAHKHDSSDYLGAILTSIDEWVHLFAIDTSSRPSSKRILRASEEAKLASMAKFMLGIAFDAGWGWDEFAKAARPKVPWVAGYGD